MAASTTEEFSEVFQAVYIPKQRAAPEPLPEGTVMAHVSTFPPLGQVTQLKNSDVNFVAVLEVDQNHVSSTWEVALWYSDSSHESQQWVEQALGPSDARQTPSDLQVLQGTSRLYYSGKLSVKSPLQFTVKFRSGPDQEWRWIRDEAGMQDGTVVINDNLDRKDTTSDLPDLIQGLNPEFRWKSVSSQSPGTRLWSVEVPVDAAHGDDSKIVDIPLGVPWGGFSR
jgi:hypothetical protein